MHVIQNLEDDLPFYAWQAGVCTDKAGVDSSLTTSGLEEGKIRRSKRRSRHICYRSEAKGRTHAEQQIK